MGNNSPASKTYITHTRKIHNNFTLTYSYTFIILYYTLIYSLWVKKFSI